MYLSEKPKCVDTERKQFSMGSKTPSNLGKPENQSSMRLEHRLLKIFSLVPDEPLYNYGDISDVSNENVVERQLETSAFATNGENILPTNVVLDNKGKLLFVDLLNVDALQMLHVSQYYTERFLCVKLITNLHRVPSWMQAAPLWSVCNSVWIVHRPVLGCALYKHYGNVAFQFWQAGFSVRQ